MAIGLLRGFADAKVKKFDAYEVRGNRLRMPGVWNSYTHTARDKQLARLRVVCETRLRTGSIWLTTSRK